MAERQPKNSFDRGDLLGLSLFVPAAFLSVLVVMDWFQSGGAGWTGRLATEVVGALGHVAPLVAALGLGATGVMVYLKGRRDSLGRHALAVVGTALGTAVLLGAVSQAAGGAFGRATGGWLATQVGEFLAVLAGLAATIVPFWLFWLRGGSFARGFAASPAPAEPTPSDSSADGVSSAEAAALVPDERFVTYMEQVWRQPRTAPPTSRTGPPSPYPEDVRLKGEIPPGAKPLSASDAEPSQASPYPAHAEPPFAAPSPGGAYVPLGKDLVAQAAVARDAALGASAAEDGGAAAAAREALGQGKAPLGYRSFFGQVPESQARASRAGTSTSEPRAPGRAVERPPRPAWEASSLFAATEAERADAAAFDEARDEDEPLDPIEAELDEELPDEEESELDEEDADLEDDDSAYAESDDDALEDDEEYEEDGDEDEDDDDPEDEDEESAELDEEEAEEEGEDEDEAEDEDDEDADEEASEQAEEILAEAAAGEAEATEPEIVLEPHPAPRSRRAARVVTDPVAPAPAPAPRQLPEDREDLVLQAGMLFLQHGRVAVSLLQRHFSLDFDQACELLDELQDRGLIGPYLGGQRRDILLSAEQWMERVGTS